MLEIGQRAGEFRGDGSTIKGVVEGLKHNKVYFVDNEYISISTANQYIRLAISPFSRWRVIGAGLYWLDASTANEDPVIEFGHKDANDAYATMTSAITGGEKFCSKDHQKLDPFGILAKEVITETSATLVVTWTTGAKFGVWETDAKSLKATEAAVAGMTSGKVKPYMIVEVDTGGKW